MTGYEHLVWAPATMTAAYFGHRVVIRWLDGQERRNTLEAERAERESGANAMCEAMAKEIANLKTRVETFIANNGARR